MVDMDVVMMLLLVPAKVLYNVWLYDFFITWRYPLNNSDVIYIYIYICVCVCVCVCARARSRCVDCYITNILLLFSEHNSLS